MNSILLSDENGNITDPYVLHHIHENLKLKLGDQIKITLLNRGIGLGVISSIDPKYCKIEIQQINAAKEPWIDLVVGVSRPQTMKKILEHGTTYGVNSFHFYRATLSEKSYLDSKVFEAASIEEHTKLGLSQSTIYAKTPSVTTYKFNPAKNFESNAQKFILDLNGSDTFMEQKINFDLPIALSVGPERGFTREDINHFTNAGFKSIKISKTVLRVEHAIYSALAQLELIKKDF